MCTPTFRFALNGVSMSSKRFKGVYVEKPSSWGDFSTLMFEVGGSAREN